MAQHANKDIDLKVERGTIHGIIGENGAGKSTLMSILRFYQADSGVIEISGKEQKILTPDDAIVAGIGMVHQHFMLVENSHGTGEYLSRVRVAQGYYLAVFRKHLQELKRLEQDYALEVDPDTLIEDSPVGLQQRVEILKRLPWRDIPISMNLYRRFNTWYRSSFRHSGPA